MQLDFLLERIAQTVESHRLSEGAYARWLYKNGTHECDCAPNEYGCADAANLLYTIGAFVREPQARAKWVAILQGMQAADTGLFCEPTHHPLHTTAHCVAALELFDQRPAHPLAALAPYRTREGLFALLEGLDWLGNPWPQSHQGAGVFAALTIAGEAVFRLAARTLRSQVGYELARGGGRAKSARGAPFVRLVPLYFQPRKRAPAHSLCRQVGGHLHRTV